MSRTPEEREAARLERERRRAAREGRPLPPEPAAPVFEDRQSALPEGEQISTAPVERHDPQPTQQYDVSLEWAAAPVATREPEPVEPSAPETAEHDLEEPLGTKRVSAAERAGAGGGRRPHLPARPHLPHRTPREPGPRDPRPPRAAGGFARRILAAVALVLLLALGWFLVSLFQPFTGKGSGTVVVKVPQGATAGQIGKLLEREDIVSSSFFFDLRAALSGQRGQLKSGTFTLHHGMSYGAALDALTHNPPPPPVIRVTIPEGRSRQEAAPLIGQAGVAGDYVAATRRSRILDPHRYGAPRGASLEGFLFPATYELKRPASVDTLVAEQLAAFKQNLAKIDLGYAKRKNLTAYDVLIIASMVEREVEIPRERPLVAAVIYNRLHDGMNLGIDATLRYALHDWTHPLRVSQLQSSTPYNTRNHPGLPPGPIGNPGLASIEAAAHPAHVPYLFYVVKPGTCGQHAFSSTDAQFQRDVARYNAARAAAGGNSPTKC
jgi:UPF0755 protein